MAYPIDLDAEIEKKRKSITELEALLSQTRSPKIYAQTRKQIDEAESDLLVLQTQKWMQRAGHFERKPPFDQIDPFAEAGDGKP